MINTIFISNNCSGIRIHNQLFRNQTLNYLAKQASMAEWMSVGLRINWLCVGIPL